MNKKNQRDQQGFHVLEISLIAVVLIVIALGGWLVWKNNSGPKLTAAQKTVQSECLKSYNDKRLCDFGAIFSLSNISYKVTDKTTKAGSTTTLAVEVDSNGNLEYNTPSGDIIKANGVTYVKPSTTKTWYKYAEGSSSTPNISNPASSIKPDFKNKPLKVLNTTISAKYRAAH